MFSFQFEKSKSIFIQSYKNNIGEKGDIDRASLRARLNKTALSPHGHAETYLIIED